MSFSFDALKYEYPSTRKVVYGNKGMVCASQPLAAQAGLDMLKQGGNAIDAAIATAISLTVLEPTSNSIGSDNFALVWVKDKLYGLNASGPSPALITADGVRERMLKATAGEVALPQVSAGKEKALAITEMPHKGVIPVTVPGAPSGWYELSKRFGKLPFAQLFEPAIRYAREGFPVSPTCAQMWEENYEDMKENHNTEEFDDWFKVFAPNGRAPRAGEIWKSERHAETLEKIANSNARDFYEGETADKIDAFFRKYDGFLRKSDLEQYKAEWVEPISVNYKGYQVWEIPPNGHGIVALMALNILNGYDFACRDKTDTFHKQLEAMKLAFVDGKRYVADPRFMKVTVEQMLSQEYAAKRRSLIGNEAIMPTPGDPKCGDTVYFCAADGEGNMISMIQSGYFNFGSGLVIPGTGVSIQNRGNNFSLDETMENCVGPSKKPYHTIIPGFLTKDGKAVGPFGVMGGFMQPQGHVQVVMNMIEFGMNPQQALDAPRWQWVGGKNIQVERGFPYAATEELIRMGHKISVMPSSISFGRGQIILRDENGVLVGATEPRTDGVVAAW